MTNFPAVQPPHDACHLIRVAVETMAPLLAPLGLVIDLLHNTKHDAWDRAVLAAYFDGITELVPIQIVRAHGTAPLAFIDGIPVLMTANALIDIARTVADILESRFLQDDKDDSQ